MSTPEAATITQALAHASAVDARKREINRYSRALADAGVGYIADGCWENVTDEFGHEPADDGTAEAEAWWKYLANSIWSEADAEGIRL